MGTYAILRVKNQTESNLLAINKDLTNAGYPSETHENILYGPFVTKAQLTEDARFMNEDPEGLQQCPHFERPITPEFLGKFFWNEIGSFCIKVSAINQEEIALAEIIFKYAYNNKSKFDWKRSENVSLPELKLRGIIIEGD